MRTAYLTIPEYKQAFAFLPGIQGGFITSPYYSFSVRHRLAGLPELTVEFTGFTVVTAGTGMVQAFRESKSPELTALADLIQAHEDEYNDLVEKERVLRALGGG